MSQRPIVSPPVVLEEATRWVPERSTAERDGVSLVVPVARWHELAEIHKPRKDGPEPFAGFKCAVCDETYDGNWCRTYAWLVSIL